MSRGGPRGRRKHGGGHEEADHGGGERWLVTYADMLTLLLVLFIVLYAMSIVDTTKFVQLRSGLAAVFNPGSNSISDKSGSITATDDGGSQTKDDITPQLMPSPASTTILSQQVAAAVSANERSSAEAQGDRVQTEVDEFKQIEAAVTAALASQGLAGSAQFNIDERGLVITIVTDTLVFGGNSATLLPGGTKILDSVTPPLLQFTNKVEVDGHTNQQNVSTGPYPSGWELSSARASSVVRYLISRFDFPQSRLSAVGYSDQKPLYPPSDPRSITLNRRVDVVVLSNLSAGDRALLPSIGAQPAS
jgi:chemotaxis protein MotB